MRLFNWLYHSIYSIEWLTQKSYFFKSYFGKDYFKLKKKILFLEIIFVEVQQRDHICRGSDQLYNSCKESRDYICKGSFEDYSVQKKDDTCKEPELLSTVIQRILNNTISQ